MIIHGTFIVFRPHRGTTYVDVAYCYRLHSMVCRSVSWGRERCEDGCTDRDAVWIVDSGGPKEACAHWRHLLNTIKPSVCGSDAIFVKLLWPLTYWLRPSQWRHVTLCVLLSHIVIIESEVFVSAIFCEWTQYDWIGAVNLPVFLERSLPLCISLSDSDFHPCLVVVVESCTAGHITLVKCYWFVI